MVKIPTKFPNSQDETQNLALWPSVGFESNGLSDSDLRALIEYRNRKNPTRAKLRLPELFFPSKIYSLGYLLRRYTGIPEWLPIPAYADHGVSFWRKLESHEIQNSARVHLVWSPWRAKPFEQLKRTVLVTHPWSLFREEIRFLPAQTSRILFFLPHSVPQYGKPLHDVKSYQSMLRSFERRGVLPSIMLHPHDISNGLYSEIRRFGYPIYTAGNPTSPLFVRRFYDVLKNFSIAVSPDLGTHVFLAQDAGVPVFLSGPMPGEPDSLAQRREGLGKRDPLRAECLKAFSGEDSLDSPDREDLTSLALGRGSPDLITDTDALREIFREEMPHILPMYAQEYGRKISDWLRGGS